MNDTARLLMMLTIFALLALFTTWPVWAVILVSFSAYFAVEHFWEPKRKIKWIKRWERKEPD